MPQKPAEIGIRHPAVVPAKTFDAAGVLPVDGSDLDARNGAGRPHMGICDISAPNESDVRGHAGLSSV
jgi:hypothetical protein